MAGRALCYDFYMSSSYRPPFPEIIRATFESRPNRFLVLCRLSDGECVRAFLPNPGRLQELLLPGVELYLVPAQISEARKTAYTMVGVAGSRYPIFLHTHVNNDVARHLLEQGLVPGLESARILRAEVPLGHSRFDFLLEQGGAPLYLEVKSCTLFGNRVAMFPDAVTARGKRHLEELAALSRSGTRSAVLFIIHSVQIRWFMPDYHTDPAFSRTLLEVRNDVEIIPLAVSWRRNFQLGATVRRVPIPWEHVARELGDRGNFLLLCREKARSTEKDEGPFHFFVGWCPSGLFSFLRGAARRPPAGANGEPLTLVEHFALVSSCDHQRKLATSLRRTFALQGGDGEWGGCAMEHAGSSASDPRQTREFHGILARYRMVRPSGPELGHSERQFPM